MKVEAPPWSTLTPSGISTNDYFVATGFTQQSKSYRGMCEEEETDPHSAGARNNYPRKASRRFDP